MKLRWFERHLNWTYLCTYLLSWPLWLLVYELILWILKANTENLNSLPHISTVLTGDIAAIVVPPPLSTGWALESTANLIAFLLTVVAVSAWVLSRKGRSMAWLLFFGLAFMGNALILVVPSVAVLVLQNKREKDPWWWVRRLYSASEGLERQSGVSTVTIRDALHTVMASHSEVFWPSSKRSDKNNE